MSLTSPNLLGPRSLETMRKQLLSLQAVSKRSAAVVDRFRFEGAGGRTSKRNGASAEPLFYCRPAGSTGGGILPPPAAPKR